MKRLYELPERQNTKLYFEDENKNKIVVIFDHLDGLFSYCWLEEDKSKLVHIKATTSFRKYKDGYKYVKENLDEQK